MTKNIFECPHSHGHDDIAGHFHCLAENIAENVAENPQTVFAYAATLPYLTTAVGGIIAASVYTIIPNTPYKIAIYSTAVISMGALYYYPNSQVADQSSHLSGHEHTNGCDHEHSEEEFDNLDSQNPPGELENVDSSTIALDDFN